MDERKAIVKDTSGFTGRWFYAWSRDAETFEGPFETREHALSEAREHATVEAEGQTSCILGIGEPVDPTRFAPVVDHLLDEMADRAGDEIEWIEDWPPIVPCAAKAELADAIAAWMRKHCPLRAWEVTVTEEVALAQEPLPMMGETT